MVRSLVLSLVTAWPLAAQEAEFSRIVDSTLAATKVPAIAAAVVTRDSVLAIGAVGVRRRGNDARVTLDDRFHLGSNTKAFTAGLAGLLFDEGRLSWDATLAALFPELAPAMRPEYRDVTVRDVLTHRAGLLRDMRGRDDEPGRAARARLVPWLLAQPPAAPRGTYAYSNAGYALAAATIERLTGESYDTLVVRRLLAPIGITTAGFGSPSRRGEANQPAGHTRRPPFARVTAIDKDNPPSADASGRMHMSMRDWARWAQAVMRAASGGASPWRSETVTTMLAVQAADSMAMGWFVFDRPWAAPSGRILVHDGTNSLFVSVAILAPERDLGILVVTNQGGSSGAEVIPALANRLRRLYTEGRE